MSSWAIPFEGADRSPTCQQGAVADGPSCLFVGPLEDADRCQLEALYTQNRLRRMGSKLVTKYPRCSLKRFSAYADAETDSSQLYTLAAVWAALLTAGVALMVAPPFCAFDHACKSFLDAHHAAATWQQAAPAAGVRPGLVANEVLLGVLGFFLGSTVATAAARSLQGLWRGSVVALKGSCPSCGEEVYAFVRADDGSSTGPRHKCECHVCEHPLVFRATLESPARRGQPWAYGRIYLVVRSKDLAPVSQSD
eukprot:jgi/Mesen1/1899/ME000143S00949